MNYIDNTEATRKNYPTNESSQNHIERTEDQVIVEHNHNCRFIFEESKGIEGLVTPSYCIRFCDHIPSMWSYFVAVGSNLISIYKVEEASGGKEAELVQHYFDKDVDRNNAENSEEFYSCTWASDKNGNPVVAAGGKRRLIKVVNMVTFECVVLVGHGEYINELRTHPIDFSLILSAARDFSIRLWNIRTMTCIAIFSGEKGHFDNIISLDIHLLGNCFASCSTDTTIKIWSLNDPNLLEQIKKSDEIDSLLATGQRYKVLFVQAPLYTTNRVHTDYVDAVKWIGDCLLTKSTNNRIALWTPDALRYKVINIACLPSPYSSYIHSLLSQQAPLILQEYHLPDSEIWFVKFDVCFPLGIFAVGNSKGKVSYFENLCAFLDSNHISSRRF
jgi:polycomb protein EED